MDRIKLSAEERKILGKKIKKIRKEGLLPANLFGKKIKSIALQLPLSDFQKAFEEAGETGLIDLKVGESTHPVLIHHLQTNPVTGAFLHADFHEVSLTEKTTAKVPVVLTGEAPAITQGLGVLINPISEIEVEALPQDLPENLMVDISKLEAVDQAITIADLKVDSKIEVKVAPEEIVVKIGPLEKEEVVEAPAAEGEVAAEGEAVAEGEAPTTEGSSEQPVQSAEEKPAETPAE